MRPKSRKNSLLLKEKNHFDLYDDLEVAGPKVVEFFARYLWWKLGPIGLTCIKLHMCGWKGEIRQGKSTPNFLYRHKRRESFFSNQPCASSQLRTQFLFFPIHKIKKEQNKKMAWFGKPMCMYMWKCSLGDSCQDKVVIDLFISLGLTNPHTLQVDLGK